MTWVHWTFLKNIVHSTKIILYSVFFFFSFQTFVHYLFFFTFVPIRISKEKGKNSTVKVLKYCNKLNIRHQLSLDSLRSLKLRKKSECFSFVRENWSCTKRYFIPHHLGTSWFSVVFYCQLHVAFLHSPPKLFVLSARIWKIVWKTCKSSSFAQPYQFSINSPHATQLCCTVFLQHVERKTCFIEIVAQHKQQKTKTKFKF